MARRRKHPTRILLLLVGVVSMAIGLFGLVPPASAATILEYDGTLTEGTIVLRAGDATYERMISDPPSTMHATFDLDTNSFSADTTFAPIYTENTPGPFGLVVYIKAEIIQIAPFEGTIGPGGAITATGQSFLALTAYRTTTGTVGQRDGQNPATDQVLASGTTCRVVLDLTVDGTFDVATRIAQISTDAFTIPEFPLDTRSTGGDAGCGAAAAEINTQIPGPANTLDLTYEGTIGIPTTTTLATTSTTAPSTTTEPSTTSSTTTEPTSTSTTITTSTSTSTSTTVPDSTTTSTTVPDSTTTSTTVPGSTTTSTVPDSTTTSTTVPGSTTTSTGPGSTTTSTTQPGSTTTSSAPGSTTSTVPGSTVAPTTLPVRTTTSTAPPSSSTSAAPATTTTIVVTTSTEPPGTTSAVVTTSTPTPPPPGGAAPGAVAGSGIGRAPSSGPAGLARTGSSVLPLTFLGIGLLMLGAASILTSRERRRLS